MPAPGALGNLLSSSGVEWQSRQRIRIGSWLPSIRTHTGLVGGEVYGERAGLWVRVDGDDPSVNAWGVIVSGYFRLTSKGSSDNNLVSIGNLPWRVTPGHPSHSAIQVSWWSAANVGLTWIGGYFAPGTDFIIITTTTTSQAGTGYLGYNQIADTFQISFSGIYFTDQP